MNSSGDTKVRSYLLGIYKKVTNSSSKKYYIFGIQVWYKKIIYKVPPSLEIELGSLRVELEKLRKENTICDIKRLNGEKLASTLKNILFRNVVSGYIPLLPDKKIIQSCFKDFNIITGIKSGVPCVKYIFGKYNEFGGGSESDKHNVALLWGCHIWGKQAEVCSYAMINNIPILFAEDGFLRSADTWCNSVIDKRYTSGISFTFSNDAHYFDATRSTLMERLINDKTLSLTKEQLDRAEKCIHYIVDNYLTKYNHQPIFTPRIGRQDRKKVLVIDQSYGDASISQGLADDNTFSEMLECAICENPDADIIIKTHPDAMAQGSGRASGYYTSIKPHDNIYTLTTPINPIALIKACDEVYVCTTQFGFEALMCGKEVHVFGMPFYAGWGLTIDAKKCERRTNKRSLAEIFYIAYIIYSHYVNPETKQPCEIEEAMEYLLSLRKEYFEKYNITNTLAVEQ